MRLNKFLRLDEAGNQTLRTRMQENLHCIAFGIGKKKITEEIWEMPDLLEKSYNSSCSLDTPFGELYAWIQNEPIWRESIVKASNLFHNSEWVKGKYKYHRNDAFMNSIYAEFQRLAKMEGIELNNDKWNPADIWASKGSIKIPSVSNVMEYNKWIYDSLHSGKLIGVSLKQITGKGKVILQSSSEPQEPMKFKAIKNPQRDENSKVGKKTMFPTGITIQLSKPGYGINVRSFNIPKAAPIRGENVVEKSKARHGKTKAKLIKDIIRDYNIPQMSMEKIKSMTEDDLQNAVIELWADNGYVFSSKQMEQDWDKAEKEIEKRIGKYGDIGRIGYWRSIINALQFGAGIANSSAADDIVNAMWQSGKSADVNSSAFIKIY